MPRWTFDAAYAGALLLAATGCGGDETLVQGSVEERVDAPAPLPSESMPAEAQRPVYAMLAVVFNPDDSATSYVALTDSLDSESAPLLESAREFAGRVNIAAAFERLYVGSYDEPTIRAFSFGDAAGWQDKGELSLASLGFQEARLESLVDARAAYTSLDEWSVERAIWDPTSVELDELREQTGVPIQKGGLALRWGAAEFGPRQGPLMRTAMYDDGDFFSIGPSTYVVSYDPLTHEEMNIFEVPCPGMYQSPQDEAGNTYLMSTVVNPVLALYGMVDGSCVRRIQVDGALDPAWQPDLRQWTGGRQVTSFNYMGDGVALGDVFHHEELEALGADFSGPYDPDMYDESQNGEHYHLWQFDLEAQTAVPVEGLAESLGASVLPLDDRTFVALFYDDWTRTEIYENVSTGYAVRRFGVDAYVENWVRVR